MSLNSILVSNIKYYRKKSNISQEDLALKSGLHRTYISMIERNKRTITINTLEKLANALNIEPHILLIERG